jgi:Rrf2 family protein
MTTERQVDALRQCAPTVMPAQRTRVRNDWRFFQDLTRQQSCNIYSYMSRDSRLSVTLHLLLHMEDIGRPVSSETLGPMLGINPVVVRRTMAGLRDAGIVRSDKGHGGGWSLARGLESVSLGDVYAALGAPALFSISLRNENPRCLIEQAVNHAIGSALSDAEARIMTELRSMSVADLVKDIRVEIARHVKGCKSHV